MRLEPLTDHLVVRLLPPRASYSGAIEIVRLDKQPQVQAVVEAVGPEVRDVCVGQRVLISRLQGVTLGADQLVLPESAVLAFLE